MDFTNPFLDFDQGYTRPFASILSTVKATLVPIAPKEESVLPKKPLTRKELKTRRGYPRGESQGESSGQILLPFSLNQNVEESFTGLPFFKRKKGHFPSSEEREERDKHLFVYRYNQGNESSRRDNGGKPYLSCTWHFSLSFIPSFYFFKTHARHQTRDKRQPLVIEGTRSDTKRLLSDYRTTRRYSHPNPTRHCHQNPWAHPPSSPTLPDDSLEGSNPSSPERRGDDEPRLASTGGRQRLPGRWVGTRLPIAQQRV